MNNHPVEAKVIAGTLGAGAGSIVTDFILWVIDTTWYPSDAAVVPTPVAAFVGLIVTGGLAFLSGYYAHHTYRYEDEVATTEIEQINNPKL
jgi:hypothetical protein